MLFTSQSPACFCDLHDTIGLMATDQKEEVKQKTDIVALIGEHVKLTRAGKHYKGLCPFHSEKTPSFIVSPELQIFKCFGCSESGDVFSFLQKYEGMEFREALQFLADRAGITLTGGFTQGTYKEVLYKINEIAAQFYHYLLLNHQSGRAALDYVLTKRGTNKQSIKTFMLGYAPENPLALFTFLTQKKKFNREDIERSGVVANVNGRAVDRFRGRVIFPLFDHRGNTVALAGRILPGPRADKLAKYINSPETEIYHKSSVLYGLNITKKAIKTEKKAIIVEGELDLISSYQNGVQNVVAIKGSALTHEQVLLLSRLTSEIILALDSDLAGDAAARRGITLATNAGLTVKVTRNDPYKDPDEFARADPEGYKKAIQKAQNVWDFIIESIVAKYDVRSGDGKAKLSRELVPLLSSIEDKIVQAHYAGIIAHKIGVSTEVVLNQLESVGKKEVPVVAALNKKEPEPLSRRDLLERDLLGLVLSLDPSLIAKDEHALLFSSHFTKRVREEVKTYLDKKNTFKLTEFLQAIPPELSAGLKDLILQSGEQTSTDVLETEIAQVKRELIKIAHKQRLTELTQLIAQYEAEGKQEQLESAEQELTELTRQLK